MKYTIYINEAKFTADGETIELVQDALERAGFAYDQKTEGYVSPGFYSTDYEALGRAEAGYEVSAGAIATDPAPTDDREYDWRNG